jgi:hypothetical protein
VLKKQSDEVTHAKSTSIKQPPAELTEGVVVEDACIQLLVSLIRACLAPVVATLNSAVAPTSLSLLLLKEPLLCCSTATAGVYPQSYSLMG